MTTAVKLSELINGNSSQIVVPSGGINFGTDTDGSGTVTGGVLDDYEEGTFTPSFISDGVSAVTYAIQQGYYTKVGRLVTVTINMFTNAVTVTNSSSNVRISGLPFTSADVTESVNTAAISETFRFNSSPPVSGRIQRNEAQIYLLSVAYTTASDPTFFTAGGLITGAGNKNVIRLTATYFVA